MDEFCHLRDRFLGCFSGLAVGDSLGAPFECRSAESICARYPTIRSLIDNPPHNQLWYTDDTQMMIGVAETLIGHGEIVDEALCAAFVSNYDPSRGYGRGARTIIEAMAAGRDCRRIAESVFPGGSKGNGAAMRVAPIGLLFRDDLDRVWEQAGRSAMPTHVHPLGIEGAQVLAVAVALASQSKTFDRSNFMDEIIVRCATAEFRERLAAAASCQTFAEAAALGNGVEALDSVPTAIACFALAPASYETAVSNAIFFGGDTDTIAAMTGALSGAYSGVAAIPQNLIAVLEDQVKGKTYIVDLAEAQYQRYLNRLNK